MPRALHSLIRAPRLSLAIIATLGLGLGALTAVFTVADGALWREPPFRGADRLAILYTTRSGPYSPGQTERWSYPAIRLLRQLSGRFAAVASYSSASLTLTGTDDPEPIAAEIASPDYFAVLGVEPARGRTFTEDENETPGAHPVAVLGYELWQRRFAGDPAMVGRVVQLSGVPLTVIGILPPGFRGLTDRAQLWVPPAMAPSLSYADYLTTDQNFISAVARLRPGVDLASARLALRDVSDRIRSALPHAAADTGETVSATAVPLNQARVDRVTRRSILTLLAAVGLLWLLAAVNASNLLLGRAAGRVREAAVRSALGAGPWRLWRDYAVEGLVLVAAGGTLGLGLAWVAANHLVPPPDLWGPRTFYGSLAAFATPAFGSRSIAFLGALCTVTAVPVALVPALMLSRSGPVAGLRIGGRSPSSGSGTLGRPSPRGALMALEAALAMVLLVGAGLLLDSYARMRRTDLGVDPDRVLTFWLRPSEVRVPPSAAPGFIRQVLDAIGRVPGVAAVTVDGGAPVSGSARSELFIVGRPEPAADAPLVLRHYVGPDHFRVLRIPLLRGRVFTAGDSAGAPRVAVISVSAARRFWPGQDPIGERVWFGTRGFDRPDSSAEIVGVVGDIASEPLDLPVNRSDFYTPYTQFTYASRMVMVRTARDPGGVLTGIRHAVLQVDPDLPLHDVQSLPDRIEASWARQRFDATLLGGLAALAVFLAASGTFAVVACAVAQREREIGIRLALGADPVAILRLVVGQGMVFPLAGTVAGTGAALMLSRLLQASLYQITPADPAVLAATVTLLLAVTLLACLLPARRATRLDPLAVLREE